MFRVEQKCMILQNPCFWTSKVFFSKSYVKFAFAVLRIIAAGIFLLLISRVSQKQVIIARSESGPGGAIQN